MPSLLIFTKSEEIAVSVNRICADSGWEVRHGTAIGDLQNGGPDDAVLIDFANPVDGVGDLVQAVSNASSFIPIIFISNDEAPPADFGEGLRYYIGPGQLIDLEHLLISLSLGFPSGASVPPAKPNAGQVPRVLIVDDNIELAGIIERSLRLLERFDVRVTSSGFEAASILPEFNPDVVVIDLVLEDMDGREVCSFIRKHEKLANTRIIGVSGYLPEDQAAEEENFFDAFLEKPFRAKDVVDCVLSLVQRP